jgi:hypothetical protein
MRFVVLQSFINVVVFSALGSLNPAMILLFPTDLPGIPNDIGPRFLAITGSSSHGLFCLFRVRNAYRLLSTRKH